MGNLVKFSQEISKLTKNREYEKALCCFKESKTNYSKEDIASNKYLISSILKCLRYTGKTSYAYRFMQAYDLIINETTEELVVNSYGWVLYQLYKEENSEILGNPDEIEKDSFSEVEDFIDVKNIEKSELISSIMELVKVAVLINSEYTKTLLSCLFSIAKYEKAKNNPNWNLINDFCDCFPIETLSEDLRVIQITKFDSKKEIEIASDKESWFSIKSKALYSICEYEYCIKISDDALNHFSRFHYSNDTWLKRNKALSNKALGNVDVALEELLLVLNRKNEWFIQKEISEIYFQKQEFDQALEYAIKGMNNIGKFEFKIELIFLIGKILKETNKNELSIKHFLLSYYIRKSEGWKISNFLDTEINSIDIDSYGTFNEIKKYLKSYWNNSLNTDSVTYTGVIEKLLNDNDRGKDGFINSNQEKYYFSIPNKISITKKVNLGVNVKFCLLNKGGKQFAKIIKIL